MYATAVLAKAVSDKTPTRTRTRTIHTSNLLIFFFSTRL